MSKGFMWDRLARLVVHYPLLNNALPLVRLPAEPSLFGIEIHLNYEKEGTMHTDEYEISVGREIVLCRKIVDRLTKALREKEKKYGMSTEELLSAFMEGRLPEINREFENWAEDARELENWRKKLRDYEEALKMLKHI